MPFGYKWYRWCPICVKPFGHDWRTGKICKHNDSAGAECIGSHFMFKELPPTTAKQWKEFSNAWKQAVRSAD